MFNAMNTNTYPANCLNCNSDELYKNHVDASGGLLGSSLLPKLGVTTWTPKMRIIVCANCGFTQFFADSKSRKRLSEKWVKITE